VIHLLLVDSDPDRELAAPPAFETLRAGGVEEALEKLSRNRRIDAVLFFDPDLARETSARISEEDPAAPPLFLAGRGEVPGVVNLPPGDLFPALESRLGEG
jgi:hypothetical protein